MLSGQQDATEHSKPGDLDEAENDDGEDEPRSHGRPRRAAQNSRNKAKPFSRKHTEGYDSLGSMDDESDATSSGNEWDGGDEDEPDDRIDDEEEDEDIDMSDNSGAEEEEEDDPRQSLVVSLRYTKSRQSPPNQDTRNGLTVSEDHSISPMTTTNSKGPSETPYSMDGPTKSLNIVPKSTQDAVPTDSFRSTQQPAPLRLASLAGHGASAQHAARTDPRPQVSHSGQSTPVAPPVSWPSSETGVVTSNGIQM